MNSENIIHVCRVSSLAFKTKLKALEYDDKAIYLFWASRFIITGNSKNDNLTFSL